MSTSPRRSGDTLICETSRKFRTSAGDRWLWVRILIDRKPGSDKEKTIGEALVSADPNGSDHDQKVELAGVALDDDREYTLRNTMGVRTADAKESPKQAHRARAYTLGPNMGPFEARCGG